MRTITMQAPWSGDYRAVYEALERERFSADSQATIFEAGTYVVPDAIKAGRSHCALTLEVRAHRRPPECRVEKTEYIKVAG
jgi:hypothetical protein